MSDSVATDKNNNTMKQLASGGSTSVLINGFGQILRLGLQLLLSRVLGANIYGLYSLGRSILEISLRVGLFGLHNALLRYIPIYQQNGDKQRLLGVILVPGLSVLMISSGVGAILWFCSELLVRELFEKPDLLPVIQWFAVTLPAYSLLTYFAFCARGFKNILYYSGVLEVAHPLLIILVASAFFLAGYRLQGAVFGFMIATVASTIIVFFLIKRLLALDDIYLSLDKSRFKFNARTIYAYAGSVFFLGFAQIILSHTDRIMLGIYVSGADIGIYAIAALLSQKVAFFQAALNGIFAPMMAGLYDKDRKDPDINILFKSATKLTQILTIPIILIMLFVGKDILFLFGEEFVDGWPVLLVLVIAQYLNISAGPVAYMLVMTGRQNIEFMNSFAMGCINVLLNFYFIPLYGAVGAAIATGISITTINVVRLIQVYRVFGCHPYKLEILPVILLFFTISGCWWWMEVMYSPGFLWSALIVSVAIVLQLVVGFGIFLDKNDKELRSLLVGRIRGKL